MVRARIAVLLGAGAILSAGGLMFCAERLGTNRAAAVTGATGPDAESVTVISSTKMMDLSAEWSPTATVIDASTPTVNDQVFSLAFDAIDGAWTKPSGTKSFWVYKDAPQYAFQLYSATPGAFTMCKFGTSCTGVLPDGGVPNLLPPGQSVMTRWRGRPSLAADRLGHVVMALLYDKDGDDPAEGVALAVSNDGGRTYEYIVDATPTSVGDSCETGEQDSPSVSWDLSSVPPVLWLSWKHGSSNICVEEFKFDFSSPNQKRGLLIPSGAQAWNVENADPSNGSAKIRASDNVVMVVFQHIDNLYDCNDSSTVSNGHWGSVVSFNRGDSWTYSGDIMETEDYDWCMFKGQNNFDGFERSMGEFDFVIAPDGNAYVAINGAHNDTFLFMSSFRGVKPQGGQDYTWFQFCGDTSQPSPWLVPSGGVAHYEGPDKMHHMCDTNPFTVPVSTNEGVALHPTLAATGDSELHLLTYESTPASSNTGLHPRYRGNLLPRAFAYASGSGMPLYGQNNDAGWFQFTLFGQTDFSPSSMTSSPADRLTLGASLALSPFATEQAPHTNTFPNSSGVLGADLMAYWMTVDPTANANRTLFQPVELTP